MPEFEQSEEYAEALKALLKPERLDLISYLEREPQTTLGDLSEYLETLGYDNAHLSLTHVHIPKLEDHGVVESEEILFDDEDEIRIEYVGDEVIEEIIGTLEEL